MKLQVYSIYDKAIASYARPFFFQTEGQAMRTFQDLVLDPESELAKHSEDYALFKLGSFDDSTGEFDPTEPVCVSRAHELRSNVLQLRQGTDDA